MCDKEKLMNFNFGHFSYVIGFLFLIFNDQDSMINFTNNSIHFVFLKRRLAHIIIIFYPTQSNVPTKEWSLISIHSYQRTFLCTRRRYKNTNRRLVIIKAKFHPDYQEIPARTEKLAYLSKNICKLVEMRLNPCKERHSNVIGIGIYGTYGNVLCRFDRI